MGLYGLAPALSSRGGTIILAGNIGAQLWRRGVCRPCRPRQSSRVGLGSGARPQPEVASGEAGRLRPGDRPRGRVTAASLPANGALNLPVPPPTSYIPAAYLLPRSPYLPMLVPCLPPG